MIKNVVKIITLLVFIPALSQDDLEKLKESIVKEGMELYRSEKASWHGTDFFLEEYKEKEKLGGYFSYVENDFSRCVFYSNDKKAKVVGSITFRESYDKSDAVIDFKKRDFSEKEALLYALREEALQRINKDTIFKFYSNTNFNLVPLIFNGEKKVYVLTGPTKSGVVLYGNDYLLTFTSKNKVESIKPLHKSLIAIEYGNDNLEDSKQIISAMHSHLPGYEEILTPTDLCTTLLYEPLTSWEAVYVLSEKYVSFWDCKEHILNVVTREEWDKAMEKEKE